ncbi:MAG: SAM-dependent methyltransferase [Acidimicrobiales bacterium]
MPSGHPSVGARWVAAHRARLARTRPSTPGGDVEGERRLYRAVGGTLAVPIGRPAGLEERTRVIDAEVARALGHGTGQVVLLGAGYDGRALRFGGGTVRWFEVDLPSTQADKGARLGALGIEPAGVTYVGVDLLRDDVGGALDAAGHDGEARSLFVCEGVPTHLSLEALASLCETLRARAPVGSVLVADFVVAPEPGARARALRATTGALLTMAGEARPNEFRPGDPEKLMVVTGWRVAHADSSVESRFDPGSHTLVLVCEPAPAR